MKHTVKNLAIILFTVLWGFSIANCVEDPFFIPVKSITGVPETGTAGVPLTLTAMVHPEIASNTAIAWSVHNQGNAGASVSGNILNTQAAGTVSIQAKVANGIGTGKDYTQDFTVEISGDLPVYTVTFETDTSPSVTTGVIIYRSSADGPTTATLNVGPGYTDIKWYYNNTLLGTEASLTLNSSNSRYNMIGIKFIRVEAWRDGVPYITNVEFEVK